jgi:hypothetical protein
VIARRRYAYLDERLLKVWEAQYTDVEEDLFVLIVLIAGDCPSVWSFDRLLEVCDSLSNFGEAQLNAIADFGIVYETPEPSFGLKWRVSVIERQPRGQLKGENRLHPGLLCPSKPPYASLRSSRSVKCIRSWNVLAGD